MLMQMLSCGGMPVLTDNLRKADEDNPKGYFEYGPVRRLKEDNTWMSLAEGKVIKVISWLLPWLPEQHSYKVIFIRRQLEEVLASQRRMLVNANMVVDNKPSDKLLGHHYKNHLCKVEGLLREKPCFETLFLDFREVIFSPEPAVACIINFLGLDLDRDTMLSVINLDLYRNKKTTLNQIRS